MKFFIKRTKGINLAETSLFDEHTFFRAFSADIKRAKNSVVIESPFMTVRRAREIAPLCERLGREGVNVRVYTRNPVHHDENLRTQANKAQRILESVDVKIILCNDLRHRKLAYIDDEILWEGSLNMLSHSNSREIMRRSVSADMCAQMQQITKLTKKW